MTWRARCGTPTGQAHRRRPGADRPAERHHRCRRPVHPAGGVQGRGPHRDRAGLREPHRRRGQRRAAGVLLAGGRVAAAHGAGGDGERRPAAARWPTPWSRPTCRPPGPARAAGSRSSACPRAPWSSPAPTATSPANAIFTEGSPLHLALEPNTLAGTALESGTNAPVNGASVQAGAKTAASDAAGKYTLRGIPGQLAGDRARRRLPDRHLHLCGDRDQEGRT